MQHLRPHHNFIFLVLISLIALMLANQPANAQMEREIFNWVANEMAEDPSGPMPAIHFVDHQALQLHFKTMNRRTFPILAARYGTVQARNIMSLYLNEIHGLYDPNSKTIYVGSFLDPCRLKAVLAHEIVHFFQFRKIGLGLRPALPAKLGQLAREQEAQHIEKKYIKTECRYSN